MTRVVILTLTAGLAAACHLGPPAPPTPLGAIDEDASIVVLNELVEAGCIARDDSSLPAVEQEHVASDEPSWLACLYDGGSIAACNTPCEDP